MAAKKKGGITVVKEAKSAVEKSDDALSEQDRDDLFTKLLTGQDATGEVETSRGTFTVKFPKEKDLLHIGRLMSINRGGLPVASFDMATENRNLICSTLNVVVTGCPEWFEKAKQEHPNFSFEEVPDDEFLLELYQKAQNFREQVQQSLTPKKGARPVNMASAESVDDPVGTGIFTGAKGSTDL